MQYLIIYYKGFNTSNLGVSNQSYVVNNHCVHFSSRNVKDYQRYTFGCICGIITTDLIIDENYL